VNDKEVEHDEEYPVTALVSSSTKVLITTAEKEQNNNDNGIA
jgi:hypothetical protein